MPWIKCGAWSVMIVLAGLNSVAVGIGSGEPGFGNEWVRNHPFVIEGLSWDAAHWNIQEYFDAGFNSLMHHPANQATVNRPAPYADAPWQAAIPIATVADGIAYFDAWKSVPGSTAWFAGDEPTRLRMPNNAAVATYVRQYNPAKLVLSTASNNGGGAADYYGDNSNPSYTYSQYLDDFISLIQPDVLMFDHYPLWSNGTTSPRYLENLMTIRQKAQANNLPYWGWLQAFGGSFGRAPSESDNRFNVYTHLTAGFTGFAYWTYDYASGAGTLQGLLDINGNPTALYGFVKQTNAEILNLGESLRFLESTDVRFVPGQHLFFGTPIPNSTPTGLSNWTLGTGGDPHIYSVAVSAGQVGTGKDGLLGLFADSNGENYFMLTNLFHGEDLSAASTSLSFVLTFDSSVNSIWRLNRLTGGSEEIVLSNHMLNWTLPGGTGDLFKYGNGNFAGLSQAIPGDFDSDGDVDGADFVVWQTHFPTTSGATSATGDADGDGDVDGADFVAWQTHFPTTSGGTVTTVLEPSPLLLSLCVGLGFARSRRTFRQSEKLH